MSDDKERGRRKKKRKQDVICVQEVRMGDRQNESNSEVECLEKEYNQSSAKARKVDLTKQNEMRRGDRQNESNLSSEDDYQYEYSQNTNKAKKGDTTKQTGEKEIAKATKDEMPQQNKAKDTVKTIETDTSKQNETKYSDCEIYSPDENEKNNKKKDDEEEMLQVTSGDEVTKADPQIYIKQELEEKENTSILNPNMEQIAEHKADLSISTATFKVEVPLETHGIEYKTSENEIILSEVQKIKPIKLTRPKCNYMNVNVCLINKQNLIWSDNIPIEMDPVDVMARMQTYAKEITDKIEYFDFLTIFGRMVRAYDDQHEKYLEIATKAKTNIQTDAPIIYLILKTKEILNNWRKFKKTLPPSAIQILESTNRKTQDQYQKDKRQTQLTEEELRIMMTRKPTENQGKTIEKTLQTETMQNNIRNYAVKNKKDIHLVEKLEEINFFLLDEEQRDEIELAKFELKDELKKVIGNKIVKEVDKYKIQSAKETNNVIISLMIYHFFYENGMSEIWEKANVRIEKAVKKLTKLCERGFEGVSENLQNLREKLKKNMETNQKQKNEKKRQTSYDEKEGGEERRGSSGRARKKSYERTEDEGGKPAERMEDERDKQRRNSQEDRAILDRERREYYDARQEIDYRKWEREGGEGGSRMYDSYQNRGQNRDRSWKFNRSYGKYGHWQKM